MIYLQLFWEFLKIGALSFGGGYAMIAPMRDMVIQNGWMTDEFFMQFIGVCESTPGVLAVNMATFIGSTEGGFFGALVATLGVILPAFCVMLLLGTVFVRFQKSRGLSAALSGIRPAALGMILSAGAWLSAQTLVFSGSKPAFSPDVKAIAIAVVLLLTMVVWKKIKKKKMPAIPLIGISAALGAALYSF